MNPATRASVAAWLLIIVPAVALATPSNPVASPLTFNTATGYYNPPTWNSMVMVNITFDGASIGWVPASYDFTVGPILKSAPANGTKTTFDPAQPWSVLNGTAFNRQLGWYDNINDDFYFSHASQLGGGLLWIDKVGGSPELKTYFVSEAGSPNGPYTPIFGTAGSLTRWMWDGYMDHSANAVSLADLKTPNQVFTANYRLYIGDANGNEVLKADGVTPKFGSLNLTWSWIGPAALPVPGDANRDGIVDMADYVAWFTNYGRTDVIWDQGNFNTDNIVDMADYVVWFGHYGQTGAVGASASSILDASSPPNPSVPEPAALAVLLGGAIALLGRRRK
ncbi:MAG: PEP-CTERM sorting domain-containing protein [Phycisphaerae bacterium]